LVEKLKKNYFSIPIYFFTTKWRVKIYKLNSTNWIELINTKNKFFIIIGMWTTNDFSLISKTRDLNVNKIKFWIKMHKFQTKKRKIEFEKNIKAFFLKYVEWTVPSKKKKVPIFSSLSILVLLFLFFVIKKPIFFFFCKIEYRPNIKDVFFNMRTG